MLAAAAGEGSSSIARREGVRTTTVGRWRTRFADKGLPGLQDEPRGGRPTEYGPQAEQRLLANPRWTAKRRRSARRRDKSDDDDALSIARVALREDPALPLVRPPADGPEEILAVLVAVREELLADATRIFKRIHAYLPLLEPDYRRLLPDRRAGGSTSRWPSRRWRRHRGCGARRAARGLRLGGGFVRERRDLVRLG
ncbi:MAG: helix-turn-helix domain-containing protein [Tepidiformaceae bacterium]